MAHGDLQLLAYQIAGSSRSGKLPEWRRFQVSGVSDLVVTDTRFAGLRPSASGHHAQWDYKIEFIPSEQSEARSRANRFVAIMPHSERTLRAKTHCGGGVARNWSGQAAGNAAKR